MNKYNEIELVEQPAIELFKSLNYNHQKLINGEINCREVDIEK